MYCSLTVIERCSLVIDLIYVLLLSDWSMNNNCSISTNQIFITETMYMGYTYFNIRDNDFGFSSTVTTNFQAGIAKIGNVCGNKIVLRLVQFWLKRNISSCMVEILDWKSIELYDNPHGQRSVNIRFAQFIKSRSFFRSPHMNIS